ncbi:MAG: ROK family protein [bacterium]|nr:ROK family protein [bacterium]
MSGLHRSLVGETVRRLIDDGLVCLSRPRISGRGRPQTPLTLDPSRRVILGVAIDPGEITAGRVNLYGEPVEAIRSRSLRRGPEPSASAAAIIQALLARTVPGIGVTVTGVVDVARGVVLESSALRGAPADLGPLHRAARDVPLLLENDLHALAQHWRMGQDIADHEDVLLVRLEDGAVGAALIIQGRPHTGCVHAASEIGHTRLGIHTRRCYCGRRGCLERVFDSRFAREQDGAARTLAERLAGSGPYDPTTKRIIELVGLGIANAAQIVKPHRLVLVSQHLRSARFRRRLLSAIRREMLASLRERVNLEWWEGSVPDRAVAAAHPALAVVLGR